MKTKTVFALILLAIGIGSVNAAAFKKISGNRLLHVPSNVIFPVKVALFNRAETELYDSTGRDVSVRYLLDELILADVYAYPSGGPRGDLKQEFARQQSDIRRLNKNVRVVSDASVQTTQGGRSLVGRRATYDLVRTKGLFGNAREVKCGSQLIIFQDGAWFIAYRFSYPRERSEIANKHVTDFLNQWHWRER